MRFVRCASLTAVLPGLMFAPCAGAHISLDQPKGRYWSDSRMQTDQGRQKHGPCGVSGDQRSTDSALVTTYHPGQSIVVRWTETVSHQGHFRIAFLADGQDFPLPTGIQASPVAPVLVDGIADPSGGPSEFSAEVTLPSVECSNCTLQLIQVMSTSPPYGPSDFYFQCADLILANGGGGSRGTGGASGGSARAIGSGGTTAGALGSGGAIVWSGGTAAGSGGGAGTPVRGGSTAVSAAGSTSGGSPAVAARGVDLVEKDAGCAVHRSPAGVAATGLWSCLVVMVWTASRRKRALREPHESA